MPKYEINQVGRERFTLKANGDRIAVMNLDRNIGLFIKLRLANGEFEANGIGGIDFSFDDSFNHAIKQREEHPELYYKLKGAC